MWKFGQKMRFCPIFNFKVVPSKYMAENQKTKKLLVFPRVLAIEISEKNFATTNASGYFSFGANLPRRKLPFFMFLKVTSISIKFGPWGFLGVRSSNPALFFSNFHQKSVKKTSHGEKCHFLKLLRFQWKLVHGGFLGPGVRIRYYLFLIFIRSGWKRPPTVKIAIF